MEISPPVQFEDTAIAFRYKSNSELRKANFIFTIVNHPAISSLATGAVRLGMSWGLPIKGLVRATVFDHFCGGETIEKTDHTVQNLGAYNVKTILDYSVEGEKSEAGFDRTADEILRTFDKAKQSSNIPFCVFKMSGMGNGELFEKIQTKQTLSAEEEDAFQKVRDRVDRICRRASETGIPLMIDAEETWLQNPIDQIVFEMMARYNQTRAVVFNTYQMYRKDSLANLKEAFHRAAMHNYFLGVKLVRGAYMEKERERALEKGHPSPILDTKEETDNSFNKALAFCVDNKQRVSMMCGSHNEYSNQYLTVLMQKHGMPPNDQRVWFAQLLGMSDVISFNLASAGFNVAKYVPYGPVESVMPYLLRRATENTSVAGQSSRELSMIRKELARRKRSAS
jgi:proline dehydrogenase